MFKLDNDFLQSLGLGGLPVDEKNRLLQMIYERLEMNVGMRLAEKMSDQQLDEFEGFIDRNDEAGALKWLESNFPNYKDVVAEELEKLKGEVQAAAPQILSAQGGSGQPMPAIAQEPMMPGIAPPQHFDAQQPQQPAPQPYQPAQAAPAQPVQPLAPQQQPIYNPQPAQPAPQQPAAQPFFGPAAPAAQPLQPYTPAPSDPQPFGPPLQPGFTPQQPQQPAPQPAPQPLPQQPMPQFGQPYMPPSADEPAPPEQPQMPQAPQFGQPAQPQQFTPPPPGFTPGQ